MREVVSALDATRAHRASPRTLYPYYQDVYDHVLRVTGVDGMRCATSITTIVETNLSLRDYRTRTRSPRR